MTDAQFSRGIRSLRQTIWSSSLYRRALRIGADLTRPVRRVELALIFRQDLRLPIKVSDANVKIEIEEASPEDVEQAASLRPVGSRLEIFRETFRWRLENGCACFMARAGSELVAYNWVRLRPGVDDGDMIALANREAFHFDSYVDENWRGHRIEAALSSRMRLFEKQHGCTTTYTKISVLNRKSLRSSRRMGWKSVGLVLRVRGSKSGGWPILTLWGSSHPLERLCPKVSAG
jgi:GNAT superfamily N-acetyltransferase